MRRRQHQERQSVAGEVLLVPNVLVARDDRREASPMRCSDQVAIAQRRPTGRRSVGGLVRSEQGNRLDRDVVILQ